MLSSGNDRNVSRRLIPKSRLSGTREMMAIDQAHDIGKFWRLKGMRIAGEGSSVEAHIWPTVTFDDCLHGAFDLER